MFNSTIMGLDFASMGKKGVQGRVGNEQNRYQKSSTKKNKVLGAEARPKD